MTAKELTLAGSCVVYEVDRCEPIGTGWAVLPDVVLVLPAAPVTGIEDVAGRDDQGSMPRWVVEVGPCHRVEAVAVHASEAGAFAIELPPGTLTPDPDAELPADICAVLDAPGGPTAGGPTAGGPDDPFCQESQMGVWVARRNPSFVCKIFPGLSACR